MKKQKGIYLVPTKKQKFGLLYCDGEKFKKFYSNSYAKELVSIISTDSDAMQIALSYVNQEPVIEKRYSPARAERIFTQNLQAVKIIRSINTILGLLLNAELSKIEKPSPDDRKGYEKAIDLQRKIYRDFSAAFQNAKVLTYIYAELPCPLEEKPKRILEIDKQLLDHTFQETYYINTKKQTEFDLGLTKCYNLVRLGIINFKAWEWANSRKAYWRIADSYVLHRSLTNEYLASVGYDDILQRYKVLHLNY